MNPGCSDACRIPECETLVSLIRPRACVQPNGGPEIDVARVATRAETRSVNMFPYIWITARQVRGVRCQSVDFP